MKAPGVSILQGRRTSTYDPVAESYGHLAERFSAGLALRAVSLARLAPGERVLDAGTGTGVVALRAARAVGPEGKVVGIDLSEGMLSLARTRVTAAFQGVVAFLRMDAGALGAREGSFDAVLSLFALPHFPNPRAAVAEMYRVLRPGGRLVLGVGYGPSVLTLSGLRRGLRRVGSLWRRSRGRELTAPHFLNGLIAQRLHGATTESASHFHEAVGNLRPLVQACGFVVTGTHWEGHEATLQTPEEFWDVQRTFSSFARGRLATAQPRQVEELRREFLERSVAVVAAGGRLVYPYGATFLCAERPRA